LAAKNSTRCFLVDLTEESCSNLKLPLETVVCEPDFDNDKLILTQKITFKVSKADCSNQPLFINAKQPTIHKSQIDSHLVDLQLAKDNLGKQYDDVFTFTVPEELQNQLSNVGQTFVLDVNADMCISSDLEGAYYSYSKVDGQPDQKLLVTQFESHFARKSFICVDEPEAKSTFNFKFIVPDGIDVLFNTVISNCSLEKKLTFQNGNFLLIIY
ncbi:MAG: hypothetical protein MHPSP_002603, partial [Paramarteilia canceri]